MGIILVATACSAGKSNQARPAAGDPAEVNVALRVDAGDLPIEGNTASVEATLACDGQPSRVISVPVPLAGSTVSGSFGSVPAANNCKVTLKTTVQLNLDIDPNPAVVRDKVQCQASSVPFNLAAGEAKDLGNIELICYVSLGASVGFEGEVVFVQRALDPYFVGPIRIVNDPETGFIPPISLSITEPLQRNVDYSWSVRPAGAGNFVGCNTNPANCEFICQANGDFHIVLTGNFGSETLSGKVPIKCRVSRCGNGYVELTETCDDSNTVSLDGCTDTCQDEFCGDGVVNDARGGVATETCDDGNTVSLDGCSASCAREFCGDRIINNNGTEECDAGPTGSIECRPNCTLIPNPYCESCLDGVYTNGRNAECTANANCKAVRECAVNTDCYVKGADVARCYCGPGVTRTQCIAPSFSPSGACRTEIVSAMAAQGLATTNVAVVSQLSSSSNSAGRAMSLLTGAATFNRCLDECTLRP